MQVDPRSEVADVRTHVVVAVGGRRGFRLRERDAANILEPAGDQLVGFVLNPLGYAGVRWSAARRIVLDSAVFGWIVRRRDDYPVGKTFRSSAVVSENRVRH